MGSIECSWEKFIFVTVVAVGIPLPSARPMSRADAQEAILSGSSTVLAPISSIVVKASGDLQSRPLPVAWSVLKSGSPVLPLI